jgi:FlgD Ig-like domain
VPPEPLGLVEGRWTLTVTAIDDQGLESSMTRRFWVNSTLGFLELGPRRILLVPPRGRPATISWRLSRPALVTVTVEATNGVRVRTVARQRFESGPASVVWDGRLRNGARVANGTYRIRVSARNEVGTVSLDRNIRVRRIAGLPK